MRSELGFAVSSSSRRRSLRVPFDANVWCAWGFQRRRCEVTEFSPKGLTIKGIDATVNTPLAIELKLPTGKFTTCGVVVHKEGINGAAGIRLLELPNALQDELEAFLWELLATPSLGRRKVCSEPGCDRPLKARGMCSRHYSRWRRQNNRRQR